MATNKILQDYGVQPNMKSKDESVVEFLEKSTWFQAMTKALQKHSEFMRPELADNYPDMEYSYPNPITPDTPVENRTDAELSPPGSLGCIITCFSPLYCDESVQCHMSFHQCPPGIGWRDCQAAQAYEYWINGMSLSTIGSTFNPDRVYPLEVGPPVGGWPTPDEGSLILHVRGRDAVGNVCETELKVFCRDRDWCCEDPAYSFTFDDASTPDQCAPGGSITVYVTGGCSPYNWQVSGTGWSFAASQTNLPSNTLNLADTACGDHSATADIVVADKCNESVNATILSTAGQWTALAYCTSCPTGCIYGDCGDRDGVCTVNIYVPESDKEYRQWFTGRNCYKSNPCSSWKMSGTGCVTACDFTPLTAAMADFGQTCTCSDGTFGQYCKYSDVQRQQWTC